MSKSAGSDPRASKPDEYVVVARRYRPQTFEELIGQGQIAQALGTAIATHRVGHAYLFTGARGVGKTSAARIFAKALNCVQGPTATPCNQCDICQSVAVGDDFDVLEIDGASNRGIDEIRQLRSNVGIRPSRARFKIYIIDEVHMLTIQAFNALLKTLEEPPEHVKFIFCTTDPEKIPITILSRCQRFDFPPIETGSIVGRLRHIVEREGLHADDEALQLLARRANGSMRDSQSLLEQMLSSCPERITVDDVHAMLGTARSGQLAALVGQVTAGKVAETFQELERAVSEGVEAGQLAEQLVGYFRDMMAAVVGCGPEMMRYTMAGEYPLIKELGERIGLESLLAMAQILDQSLSRMRYSGHVRTLLEVALVRICRLERLDDLSQLVAQIRAGGMTAGGPPVPGASARGAPSAKKTAQEKKTEHRSTVSSDQSVPVAANGATSAAPVAPTVRSESCGESVATGSDSSPVAASGVSLSPQAQSSPHIDTTNWSGTAATSGLAPESVESVWKEALATLGGMTAEFARQAERVVLAGSNRLVAHFRAGYSLEYCERTERRSMLEEALTRVVGQPVRLEVVCAPGEPDRDERAPPVTSARQRQRERELHPLVHRALEMFDAEVIRIDEPRGDAPARVAR